MKLTVKLIFISFILLASVANAQQPSIMPYNMDLTKIINIHIPFSL